MGQVSVTLVFQDAAGNPLANGKAQLRLSQDGSLGTAGGPSVSTKAVSLSLDSSGSVTFLIWPNDLLFPAGSVYFVIAFSSLGELSWNGQMTFHS